MATFYEAVEGVTHGIAYHPVGEVFVGDAVLDDAYADTQGKTLDGRVLYKPSSKEAYEEYLRNQQHLLVDGSPRGVVGFEPTGEDSFVGSQKVNDDGSGDLVEADPQVAKPEDGDPLVPDSAEAERRLNAPADEDVLATTPVAEGVEGGSGPAPVTVKKK
jgi:hypothetical protein